MAIMFDWLPTLAGLCGATLPVDRKIDGKDIWPLIVSEPGAKSPHDRLLYCSREGLASAIRSGKWKLHVVAPVERWAGKLPPETLLDRKPVEPLPWLYDLEADIGETRNVAAEHPDVVTKLKAMLEETDQELTREARPIFISPNEPPQPPRGRPKAEK
jgi:arylsulfatase A-like enzyme